MIMIIISRFLLGVGQTERPCIAGVQGVLPGEFCSECQLAHWPTHKDVCKKYTLATRQPGPAEKLQGRRLRKLSGR